MSKKVFFIILGISIGIWLVSALVQPFVDIFIFKKPSISLFDSACNVTGYPVALCIDGSNNARYIYYILNISLWFLALTLIWKKAFKRRN